MINTLYGFIFLIIFLMPGFISLHFQETIIPTRKNKGYNFILNLALYSFFIQIVPISIFLLVSILLKIELQTIKYIVNNNPFICLSIFCGYLLFISILAGLLGCYWGKSISKKKSIENYLRKKSGLSSKNSVWEKVVSYNRSKKKPIAVMVNHKDGTIYSGILKFSPTLVSDESNFSFYMTSVKRKKKTEEN